MLHTAIVEAGKVIDLCSVYHGTLIVFSQDVQNKKGSFRFDDMIGKPFGIKVVNSHLGCPSRHRLITHIQGGLQAWSGALLCAEGDARSMDDRLETPYSSQHNCNNHAHRPCQLMPSDLDHLCCRHCDDLLLLRLKARLGGGRIRCACTR